MLSPGEINKIIHPVNSFKAQPYLLQGKIQNYSWGTKNKDAIIPRLLNIPVEKNTPYAEYWMGSHPKAPSDIRIDNSYIPFDTLIKQFPNEVLGKRIYKKFQKLPFLFKVLSAAEALSIQAHPNKEQAGILHAKDPQHYPDNNHKPEIAIALSELYALVGFKTFDQLSETFANYPEIAAFIGKNNVIAISKGRNLSEEDKKSVLKKMYGTYMKKSLSNKDELLMAIENLDKRLSQKKHLSPSEKLFFELRKIYPGSDSGLFSLFLLNRIHLKQGQGIFLKAGLPHAYLKGNIIECMANSDNVVRAGLTLKFQDVNTLLDILTYETSAINIQQGAYQGSELFYKAPVPEFKISRIDVHKNSVEQKTKSLQILLVTDGSINILYENGKEIFSKGQSVLIPATLNSYKITSSETATIFKVMVP